MAYPMKTQNIQFQSAVHVWAAGREKELNLWLSARAKLPRVESCILKLTGSSAYIVKVDGAFIAFGPARSAHGFYRVGVEYGGVGYGSGFLCGGVFDTIVCQVDVGGLFSTFCYGLGFEAVAGDDGKCLEGITPGRIGAVALFLCCRRQGEQTYPYEEE